MEAFYRKLGYVGASYPPRDKLDKLTTDPLFHLYSLQIRAALSTYIQRWRNDDSGSRLHGKTAVMRPERAEAGGSDRAV